MNNAKHNIRRTPRQLARRKSDRGCEPSSLKLSSRLFRLFPIYLDKVLSVTDGDTKRTFTYHADGQLASATVGSALRADRGATPLSETETFLWDGLALIQRGDEQFVNEPHVGGGNPVASSKGTSYFNDALGTTVGAKSNGKYSPAALTAFGENLSVGSPTPTQNSNFFTGKPFVEGLGHAFWMRNYRASLAKWQTADPMGYPDGWNQLAYCGNGVVSRIDYQGCSWQIWDYYKNKTHETEDAWMEYKRIHKNQCPLRLECYEHKVEEDVFIHEVYRGVGIIDGQKYDIYQQFYYDIYAMDVYAAIDPIGEFRDYLLPIGISLGVGGIITAVALTGPWAIAAGVAISVAGVAITIAGELKPLDWKLIGTIYNYHPDSVTFKYRREL